MSKNIPTFVEIANVGELRNDGVYKVENIDDVIKLMLRGTPSNKLSCEHPDVTTFNKLVGSQDEFCCEPNELSYEWKLPSEYLSFEIEELVYSKLADYCDKMSDVDFIMYSDRVELELSLFMSVDSGIFLKCIWFILDSFSKKGVFWGVGRGSSCASLVLFLIGLHMVDPILYEIPITDFFKTENSA